MSEYPSCVSSENVVCKHVRATKTFYFDLNNVLPVGVTLSTVDADTPDEALGVDAVEILEEDLTVDASQGCAGTQLEGGRAILVVLSGGTVTGEETTVTVSWTDSEGGEDARDGRFLITGVAAP